MESITNSLQHLISEALAQLGDGAVSSIHFERPSDAKFGDFSTNVAMVSLNTFRFKNEHYSNPRAFATAIVEKIQNLETPKKNLISKVEVAGPGFINFYLTDYFLLKELEKVNQSQGEVIEKKNQGKKVVVEYMQPNTNKPLHVGHLRNAILGKAVIEVMKKTGWEVKSATINNDRGLHIIKSMWGYLIKAQKGDQFSAESDWRAVIQAWQKNPHEWFFPEEMEDVRLHKPDHFVGYWYTAADASVEDQAVQKAWQEMLLAWENSSDPSHNLVRSLWQVMNEWFYQGYQKSAERIGVEFDQDSISYESRIYEAGRQIILDNVKKGIFTKLESGAVQANLEQYKLPNKILLRSDGTGIYMTFDIELTRQRSEQQADLMVWVVGNDQKLYFQQLFAIAEQLHYGNLDRFYHFSYGMVRLPEGKMSSRKGRVLYADDVLDIATEKASAIMEETGMSKQLNSQEVLQTTEAIGVGAVKWAMLMQDPTSEITFDIKKSVNLHGNSGPYIQYTYARCQSVLRMAVDQGLSIDGAGSIEHYVLNSEERTVSQLLTQFNEVVQRAATEFAPHHICTYLFELAQAYNAFYNQHSILGGKGPVKTNNVDQIKFRLQLTQAAAIMLHQGLGLLGIQTMERM